jgi:N6-L-threonylcarbamoyladenine synthase
MKVLGIESSCDETAASVVEDGFRLLSNVVRSQIDIHKAYGGVVPEVAARSHIEVIVPVVEEALEQAGCSWDDIDAIAVTYAPGLIGSLLVGTLAARTLALTKHKPLYPVHHVEGHVYANFLVEQQLQNDSTAQARSAQTADSYRLAGQEMASRRSETILQLPSKQPAFPMLALIVSGGHSQLVLFRDHGNYELLGQTQDDAVGEAFDKVAKILGLPYPGGPSVARAAESGDPTAFALPTAKLSGEYDFSFSGLKTAVLRAVQKEVGVGHDFPSHDLPERVSEALRANMSASFQYVAVKTLVETTLRAFYAYSPASVVIAGGVAANQELRRQLQEALPIPIEYAPMSLCTDNAAMIATLGYYHAQKLAPTDPYDLEVLPSISMAKTAWSV